MNHIYILNPEGNNGNGRITRYVGRGAGIQEHIALIDVLIEANREAQAILELAQTEDLEYADITEPANAAAQAQRTLRMQALYN